MNINTHHNFELQPKTSRKERVASNILEIANFYSKKTNQDKVKAVLNATVDDVGAMSQTILKAKKHGIGTGLIALLLPRTVSAITIFIEAEEAEEKENATNKENPFTTQSND
jgi:hypothetical protein